MLTPRLTLGFLCACACWNAASSAWACGVSGPDGVWSCSLEEHEVETRPRWVMGVAGVYSRTSLQFGDAVRAGQSRHALVGVGAYSLTPALSLRASAGVAFAGELRAPDGVHAFDPGPTLALGADYRLLGGKGKAFWLLSAMVSATTARTHLGTQSARYSAFDLRLGTAFGVQLFEMLRPYALLRVFGGPAFWRYAGSSRVGTDVYHYQIGVGLAWLIAERVDISFEGVPLGERALSGAVAVVF